MRCALLLRPVPARLGGRRTLATNPMFDITGKTALVTGGARDIGGACATELAAAGADVVIGYHASADAAEATVDAIRALGRRATAVRADVFEAAGRETLVAEAETFFGGPIDVLVNNAGGLNARAELCDDAMTEELMVENLNMNYVSVAMMCKRVIPGMQARGFGRIVNIGSIAGNNGGSGTTTPHYGPAKSAVACLGRSLAQTYAKDGVNCNTIAPGVIDNGFHEAHTSDEAMAAMATRIPQGRFGRNEEVGAVAAFLASPAAAHIVGDVIHVNGGMLFGS